MVNYYIGMLDERDRKAFISELCEQQMVLDAQQNDNIELLEEYMLKKEDFEFRTLQ